MMASRRLVEKLQQLQHFKMTLIARNPCTILKALCCHWLIVVSKIGACDLLFDQTGMFQDVIKKLSHVHTTTNAFFGRGITLLSFRHRS